MVVFYVAASIVLAVLVYGIGRMIGTQAGIEIERQRCEAIARQMLETDGSLNTVALGEVRQRVYVIADRIVTGCAVDQWMSERN